MTTNNIPVSLEFFKKYTYHEECVDILLKQKAKGDHQMYDRLINNKDAQERALKAYYEAFYLRPEIRAKYHIRFKSAPKTIKDKLLSIPVQDTCAINEAVREQNEGQTAIEIDIEDLVSNKVVDTNTGNKNTPKKRVLEATQNDCNANCVVDDDQPEGRSSNSTNTTPSFDYKSLIQYLHCCPLNFKEFRKYSNIDKLVADFCKIKNMNAHQQRLVLHRSHVLFYLAPEHRKIPPINEIQLLDNCPLSIKEKFFSIPTNLYIKEKHEPKESKKPTTLGIEKQLNNAVDQRVLNSSANNSNSDTQLTAPVAVNVDNATSGPKTVIAAKTFTFDISKESTNKDLQSSENREYAEVSNSTKNYTAKNDNNVQPNKSSSTIQHKVSPASQFTVAINKIEERSHEPIQNIIFTDTVPKNNTTSSLIKSNNNNTRLEVHSAHTIQQLHTICPAKTCTGDIREQNNETLQTLNSAPIDSMRLNDADPSCSGSGIASPVVNTLTPHSAQTNSHYIKNIQTCTPASSASDAILKFPVSLNEFKKYTHYEEIVEKLVKLKTQDNEDLFLKYKSNKKVLDAVLMKYYHAFYLLPAIRDMFPIRLKPMPRFKKNLLLQIPEGVIVIPLNNITVEQFMLPDLNTFDMNTKKSSSTVEAECSTKPTEDQLMETETFVEIEIGTSSSPAHIVMPAVTVENNTESLKKTSNEIVESPSPKRQKIDQCPSNTNISYNELLQYAHCCPVTFSDFTKYTNLSELFSGYCQKRYNSMRKLPHMLKRAYILFYLAPENRNLKPFNKFKISDKCPLAIKEKILEIPTNMTKRERKDYDDPDKITSEIQMQQRAKDMEVAKASKENNRQHVSSEQKTSPQKPIIEILENRLLPPIKKPLLSQSNKQDCLCLNSSCMFNHITYTDINKHTNIPSVQPVNIFKQLIYNIVNELGCAEKYMISATLLAKMYQYKTICDKCEGDVQSLRNTVTPATSCSMAQSDRTSNTSIETVVERCNVNNKRSPKQTENVTDNDSTRHVATRIKTIDIWKNKKLFSKFCQKLLAKLQQPFEENVDFCSENYEMFLECNEIPLRELLVDIFAGNDNNVQSILNNAELYQALQRYYYFKYMTNRDFALKYPVKALTENNEKRPGEEKEADNINSSVLSETNLNSTSSSNAENTTLINSVNIHDDTETEVSLSQEKLTSVNNALEKAKRIFFRNVDKTQTLAYVLRTTFGYKHVILRAIVSLTFNEFLELTSVYEGNDMYADEQLVECMYRYVCRTPLVWPTNLYITLEKLCNFLRTKNIHFDNYSTMLYYISPKLLHWSNLLSCSNILDCVKNDYEKRTGKLVDTDDISSLKQECIEYYNRCWTQEKWLADTPLLDEEFCKNISGDVNSTDDVLMTVEPTTICSCKQVDDEANNDATANKLHAPNCGSDLIIISPSQMNQLASAEEDSNEDNYVLLPSTQQQIEMLPDEQNASNDALSNSDGSQLNLNISQSSIASSEIESVGELIPPVKTEPDERKLLSNLIFYEDDNSDMQCVAHEQEIVELDATLQSQIAGENMPASQIDFVLNSEDRQLLLSQLFPGTGNNSQQSSFQCGQLSHLQDDNLLSSGEKAHSKSEPAVNLQEPVHNELLQNFSEQSYLHLKNYPIHQEAQRLQSSFEETQISSGHSVEVQQQKVDKNSAKPIKNIIDSVLAVKAKHQETKTTDEQIEASTSKASCKSSYQTHKRALPKRIEIKNTKSKKNVAKIKPLPNSGLVPQIQHNTRPLQTVPAFTANASNINPVQFPEAQVVAPTSLMLNLTPTSGSQNLTAPSSQNSSFQLQIPQFGTHIFISQELNKNCSVFDNSSLLRIVDHNYHKESAKNLAHNTSEQLPLQKETQQQTDQKVTTHINTMCPGNNTLKSDQSNQNNEQPKDTPNVRLAPRVTKGNSKSLPSCSQTNTRSNLLKISKASDSQQQEACRRIITRRISSLCKDTNEKVNNFTLTNTNNLVTSITITIHQRHIAQPLHSPTEQTTEITRKVFLYRCISKFHYFKELTSQHMSNYLLPSLQIGKSYSEALVVCENFKTRVSNRSISALFPFWPASLQKDFLLVVDDLKEFHYNIFEKKTMRKQEDFRARVLFWLLDTAPSFSLCQFVYEKNNSEFSHCEAIRSCNNPSYERKPFKCLTNALDAKILKKLGEIKSAAIAK